jgi:hypothetical protein
MSLAGQQRGESAIPWADEEEEEAMGSGDAAGPGRMSVPMVGPRNQPPAASSHAPLPQRGKKKRLGPVISFATEYGRRRGRGGEVARTWRTWDGEMVSSLERRSTNG